MKSISVITSEYERSLGEDEYAAESEPSLPEVACIGRSNVGKSTLINRLTSRKKLAHVSSQPGHTRAFNLYRVKLKHNDSGTDSRTVELRLVDLPGFGYAKFSKERRSELSRNIVEFISLRPALRLLFLLVDVRRDPREDELAIQRLCFERGLAFQIVATKVDKLSRNELPVRRKKLAEAFGLEPEDLLLSDPSCEVSGFWERVLVAVSE